MTILEMTQRPHVELADLLPSVERGDEIVIERNGDVVARLEPVHRRSAWQKDMAAFRAGLGVSVMGNAVLEMREEDDR